MAKQVRAFLAHCSIQTHIRVHVSGYNVTAHEFFFNISTLFLKHFHELFSFLYQVI